MKKISITLFSLILAACSSSDDSYQTEVTSESYKEEYTVAAVPMAQPENLQEADMQQAQPVQAIRPVQTAQPVSTAKSVRILPPTQQQKESYKRFGYTIQVIAMDSSKNSASFANSLPDGQPVWEHYKQVNGTDWYTLLYGDYATKSEAKAAIALLPSYFRDLKPFVKSIDEIVNSAYPKLRKIK